MLRTSVEVEAFLKWSLERDQHLATCCRRSSYAQSAMARCGVLHNSCIFAAPIYDARENILLPETTSAPARPGPKPPTILGQIPSSFIV